MKEAGRILTQLLRSVIDGREPMLPDQIAWESVLFLSESHAIDMLIYPLIDRMSRAGKIVLPDELLSDWRSTTLYRTLTDMQQTEGFAAVLHAYAERNVPVICLKGVVLRDLYPRPELRSMGDIDLLVKPQDLEQAAAILNEFGYEETHRYQRVTTYRHAELKNVELHAQLLDDNLSGDLIRFEQEVWETAIPGRILGEHALMMSPVYGLVFLILHLYKHYRHVGAGLRQLCDIALYIKHYGDNLEPSVFRDLAERMQIIRFASLILQACRERLGVDGLRILPGVVLAAKEHADLFMQELIEGGVFGRAKEENAIEKLLMSQQPNNPVSYIRNVMRRGAEVVFPGRSHLSDRYSYVKRVPLLVPAAWVHRIGYSLVFRLKQVKLFLCSFFSLLLSSRKKKYLRAIGAITEESGKSN